jgi:cytochrome c biogenesis protein CcdA
MKRFIPFIVILIMGYCALPLHGSDRYGDLDRTSHESSMDNTYAFSSVTSTEYPSRNPVPRGQEAQWGTGRGGIHDMLTAFQLNAITPKDTEMTFRELLLGLLLGLISGLSPTLLKNYSDIISEVAQTTRQEKDVIIRSLLFCGGVFAVLICLFFILTSLEFFSFLTVLLGTVVVINLLNSALHAFNSYTRIDLILRAKFTSFTSLSSLQIGLLHGIAKFPDSAPLFLVMVYLAITRGSTGQDIQILVLYLSGILLSYGTLLLYALFRVNIFRKFSHNRFMQVYFMSSAFFVLVTSVLLMWNIKTTVDTSLAILLTGIIMVISGVLIGFKKRIIY